MLTGKEMTPDEYRRYHAAVALDLMKRTDANRIARGETPYTEETRRPKIKGIFASQFSSYVHCQLDQRSLN